MSLRRHAILMAGLTAGVFPAPTAAGKVAPTTVNARGPEGQPTGQGGAGAPGLDIDFGGSAPAISSLAVTKANAPLVAYLSGDSTSESAFHRHLADAAGAVHYDSATHLFTVTVTPGADHNAVIVLTR
ncbi:hypothetical protein [Kutzneria sp. NPDC051319]|uniref:hypothetical protein n=1 Tax=Kutzneria sp. NPDC051319 TaxID=3155047 RepID=UPI003426D83C